MTKTAAQIRATEKYSANNYSSLACRLPKETVRKYKEKCEKLGVSQRAMMLELVTNFIENE